MKSIITVWQDDFLLFRGRVLDEEGGWYNEKAVTCEGDMAFLLDSIQRPSSFTVTAAEYLAYITETHNRQVEPEKRFSVGFSATTEPFDIERTEYTTSLEALQKGLLDALCRRYPDARDKLLSALMNEEQYGLWERGPKEEEEP
jgi:hypothetical protein